MSARQSILHSLPPTRFRDTGRPLAMAILLALLVAIGALFMVSQSYQAPVAAGTPEQGDLAMYRRVAEAMRNGANYYDVAHEELLKGSYGTRSVFNWRLPALPWLASRVPSAAWADTLFRLATIAAALAMALAMARRYGVDIGILTLAAISINLVSAAAPGSAVFSDIVAGVLILAAVAAYGLGRPLAGVAIALLALFMRELVAPAVCVFILLAWQERRRGELIAWAVGLAAFAGYFAWHALSVHAQLNPADVAYPSGWVQFGGLTFILSTAAFNGLFMTAPPAVSAVLLPLCVLGLAAWQGKLARRVQLTVAAYLVLFAVVGKPFNDYWGALYTPLLMLGLPVLPGALRDAARAIGHREPATAQG